LKNARLVNEIFYLALIDLASAENASHVDDVRQSAAEALTKLEGWVSTSE